MRNSNTECHQCKSPMYCRPSQMSNQKTWFCGKSCREAFLEERRKYKLCLQCKEKFLPERRKREQKYCSRTCSNSARKGIKYRQGRPNCNVNKIELLKNLCIQRDGHKCLICGLPPIWNDKELILQLDHIDGDSKNNYEENLRLLCPNCHTQTETFAGRNIKKKKCSEYPNG